MKKLLLLLVCAPCALLSMQKAAKNLDDFITMEHKHTQDWLNYKKAKFNTKMDLIQKYKDASFDLKKKHIDMLAKGESPEVFLTAKLNDMIKIHKELKNDWNAMRESNHKKSSDIINTHKIELDQFEKAIAPHKEKKTEEEKAEEKE